jgi:hypothetical protein
MSTKNVIKVQERPSIAFIISSYFNTKEFIKGLNSVDSEMFEEVLSDGLSVLNRIEKAQ